MTEISHVTGKDNVVADALSRYPELVGQSYDHLLPEEQEMISYVFTFSISRLREGILRCVWTISVPPLSYFQMMTPHR